MRALLITIAMFFVLVGPTLRAQEEEPPDCEGAYAEQVGAWIQFLNSGRQGEAPSRSDSGSDCFEMLLQAQVDALTMFIPTAATSTSAPTMTPRVPQTPTATPFHMPAPYGVSAIARNQTVDVGWSYRSDIAYQMSVRVTRDGAPVRDASFADRPQGPGLVQRTVSIHNLVPGVEHCFEVFAHTTGGRSPSVIVCAVPLFGRM